MRAIAGCASTLGSRFNLIFDPESRRVYHNTFGVFPGVPLQFSAAVELPGGRKICLPFADAEDYFDGLEYFPALTGFRYRGCRPDLGLELSLEVTAPFYPGDIKVSTAPFFFVEISAGKMPGADPGAVEAIAGGARIVFSVINAPGGCRDIEGGFEYHIESPAARGAKDDGSQHKITSTAVRCRGLGEFEMTAGSQEIALPLDITEPQSLRLLCSGWCGSPALEIDGAEAGFKYKQFFSSEPGMFEWGSTNYRSIIKKCGFVNGLFRDWSLGAAASHFTAHAFHSFAAGSWWVVRGNGEDWFSVWDGAGYCHSPLDIEYNCAMLYIHLWPEILEMLLRQWAGFESVVNGNKEQGQAESSYLDRNMGTFCAAGRAASENHMKIETNADYLLLMAAMTFFGGNTKLLKEYLPLCRRLAEFIVRSDTDGDGFPDICTASTISDAGPALQFSRGQVYLAVKAQAALWSLGEMEEFLEKSGGKCIADRWKSFAAKGIKTLGEEAWIKDHYAVCLERSADGLVNPFTGSPLSGGELSGWDDYSIYTANGLLYLFLANIKMPRWNHMRILCDLKASESATRTDYGSRHTASGGDIWFSQNLWRDYVAAFYGVDMLCKVENYMDFQCIPGAEAGPCPYRDSTQNPLLHFSPRGVTVFGAAAASAGLRINRVDKEIHLAPVRGTLRVPVLAFADWETMRAPWINVETREGITTVRIDEKDLLDAMKVHVVGAELEQA